MWPSHYRDFIETHRLIGREVELTETQDLSTIGATIRLYSEREAIDEAERFFPGLIVKEHGYVPIGEDPTGSGDPYFINTRDQAPGPVYRIYHDSVSDFSYDPDEAICKVLSSYKSLPEHLVANG